MNRSDVSNPFSRLKVRRLVLWSFLLLFAFGLALGNLSRFLGLDVNDDLWKSIGYIFLMVSVCLLTLRQFDRLHIRLEDVVGTLPTRPQWWLLAGLVIAILLCSLGMFQVSFYLISLVAPGQVEQLLQGLSSSSTQTSQPLLNLVFSAITAVVVAPIVEEFLFRGVLLQRWATKWGMRSALIGSSIVFGLLHANFAGLTIFGLIMALLYLKTRTLLIPIACHAFNNALAIGLSYLPDPSSSTSTLTNLDQFRQSSGWGIVLLLLAAPWLIRFIHSNFPRHDVPIPYLVNQSHTAGRS